jgi:hypothetical protein
MGVVVAMTLVGILLVGDSNRKLDELCAQEVLDGVSESVQECRNWYVKEK